MYGRKLCVAGWDEENGRMVRPLSGPQSHWVFTHASTRKFWTGNIVTLHPTGVPTTRGFPHRFEDVPVFKTRFDYQGRLEGANFADAVAGSVSNSIPRIFNENLLSTGSSYYVEPGVRCPSLGAVDKKVGDVIFEESEWDGKYTLKCQIRDGSRWFRFTVSSKTLKDIYDTSGVEGLEALKENCTRAHVRIGLAGAWRPPNPDIPRGCYAMVNNIIFY